MACMVPSPKGILHKQLIQLKKAQVTLSSTKQPSTHIIMCVYLYLPCLQGGADNSGHIFSVK